jgi:hypothetical protein
MAGMKKVTFSARRPSEPLPKTIDDWVEDRDPGEPEPIKRLTVDMPISLHRRVKIQCAQQNLVMTEVIREFLEKRFPEASSEQGST